MLFSSGVFGPLSLLLGMAMLFGCGRERDENTSGPDLNVPILETGAGGRVTIRHRELTASWWLRFPEAAGTPDSLAFYPTRTQDDTISWQEYDERTFGYRWRPAQQMREATSDDAAIRPVLAVAAHLRPSADRIDLTIELENLSNGVLTGVWSDGGDLQSMTARFIDDSYSHTFIRTATGLTRLSETPRTQGIRCTYVFEPSWYETPIFKKYENFWGRSSTQPTSAFIAVASEDGVGAVGIGYDHAFKLMQNSDRHRCIHSGPLFGTLEPGERKMRRGVILFGKTVQEIFERFESLGFRPDPAPPNPG